MMFKLQMCLYDTVTGRSEFRDLPHLYRDKKAAYDAENFFTDLGGEWSDHDDVNSHPIHVTYSTVRDGNLLN